MRYRRRRFEVEAYQFDSDAPWPKGVFKDTLLGWFRVETPSGDMRIEPGDWIVTFDDGTMIRMRPGHFEQLYEPSKDAGP